MYAIRSYYADAGNELLIRRVIQRGGRSRTYVNGALTTASRLAELGESLVELSGQHPHPGLVDPRITSSNVCCTKLLRVD